MLRCRRISAPFSSGCALQLSVSAETVLAVGESAASAGITPSTALRIISAAVFSAPCEEVIFRSGIFKKLRSAAPKTASVLISSLFFALCHPSLQAAVYSFAAGAVFALMLEKYESIFPPIAAHASFNLFALAPSAYPRKGHGDRGALRLSSRRASSRGDPLRAVPAGTQKEKLSDGCGQR